jgi:hypothetical protein
MKTASNKAFTMYSTLYNVPITVYARNKHIASGRVRHMLGLRDNEKLIRLGANL